MSFDAQAIRKEIWVQLLQVAERHPYFGYDFKEVIPNFRGSDAAVHTIRQLPAWRSSRLLFLTPDEIWQLRYWALREGKVFLITTYGILDGFRIVDPSEFSSEHYEFASTLQGIEEYGHKISLAEIACLGGIDLLVTGGFAMSRTNWVRFGKGHGYFDLEAAMLNDAGCLSSDPKVLGIVHDCQVKDFDFPASPLDTRVDIIITGTSTFHAPAGQGFHRTSIDWTRLAPEDLVRMSVLKELQQAQEKEKNS